MRRISLASCAAIVARRPDVGAGDDEREVALAVVLEEPEADVGDVAASGRRSARSQLLLRQLRVRPCGT